MVSTIGPLVKVAGRTWLKSTLAFVVACTVAGAGGGFVIGSAGSLMPMDQKGAAIVLAGFAGFLAALEMGAFGGVRLLAGSVPQHWWVHLGPTRASLAYGGVLGLGVTTAIPFAAFYILPVSALLAGPGYGALIGATYGFARALPVPIASFAMWLGADCQKVSDWALGGHRLTAKRTCAVAASMVALVAAAALA